MTITLIMGPMYSGKTTELIRLIKRGKHAQKKCLIIKYARDLRYDSEFVTTHDHYQYREVDIIHMEFLTKDLLNEYITDKPYDIIGIEEGQFFVNEKQDSVGLAEFCEGCANNGIEIVVSALDGNFKQELFYEVGKLIPKAENIIKLSAICMICHTADAHFTIRKTNDQTEVVIGGTELYSSICRKCLIKH